MCFRATPIASLASYNGKKIITRVAAQPQINAMMTQKVKYPSENTPAGSANSGHTKIKTRDSTEPQIMVNFRAFSRPSLESAPSLASSAEPSYSIIGISWVATQSKSCGKMNDMTMHTIPDRQMATMLPASMG